MSQQLVITQTLDMSVKDFVQWAITQWLLVRNHAAHASRDTIVIQLVSPIPLHLVFVQMGTIAPPTNLLLFLEELLMKSILVLPVPILTSQVRQLHQTVLIVQQLWLVRLLELRLSLQQYSALLVITAPKVLRPDSLTLKDQAITDLALQVTTALKAVHHLLHVRLALGTHKSVPYHLTTVSSVHLVTFVLLWVLRFQQLTHQLDIFQVTELHRRHSRTLILDSSLPLAL